MKLTVLVDNNTYIDRYYYGEPALSFYLETDEERILFDAGYSDILLRNAEKMGIDLSALTHIVISHGHDDHTRGLQFLMERVNLRRIPLIAHPACFVPRMCNGVQMGPPYSAEQMEKWMDVRWSKEPLSLSERLIFLGEIPRAFAFEPSYVMGERQYDGIWVPDTLADDSALVYQSDEGLFVVTGCSHSGICNIIDYAKQVTGEERVLGVIGGFHLFDDDARLTQTVHYLQMQQMKRLYPCHCVSLVAKAKMISEGLPVEEVGVGLSLDIV